MRKKALVLDIDGTLTNSRKEISPVTKSALLRIMERGHMVALASGRPAFGMRRYGEELNLHRYGGYLLAYNGARVISCSTGETVFQRTLPEELLPELFAFARKEGCGLATHTEDTVISAFLPDEYIELEARINGMPVRQAECFSEYVNFAVCKCFMTAPAERAAELEKILREQAAGLASVYRSEPFFIEIVPEKVDKGDSLRRLTERLGIDREDVVCCGDGYNDIPMLVYAGVGAAMGNAQPEVKAAADYVTESNDEDGIASVIERFIEI